MSLPRIARPSLAAVALAVSGASCTVVSVQSRDNPAGVRADGLIDGHAVVGWRDENQAVRLDLFDGTSSGAVFEFVLWKLARLELGLAGFGVGVGPFDVGLGALWYDPHLPIKQTPKASKSKPAERVEPAQPAAPASEAGACEQPSCAHEREG